ncbi:Gcfc2 [Symbiodinium sp. KB8]|nr:Gcfc2 [Symbiodinium sp. KB8]
MDKGLQRLSWSQQKLPDAQLPLAANARAWLALRRAGRELTKSPGWLEEEARNWVQTMQAMMPKTVTYRRHSDGVEVEWKPQITRSLFGLPCYAPSLSLFRPSPQDDEEEVPMFKVKKTRLSRQMAATKAPADLNSFRRSSKPKGLRSKAEEDKEEPPEPPAPQAVQAPEPEPLSEPMEPVDKESEDEADGEESKAVLAARLARAQRAAARELGAPAPRAGRYTAMTGPPAKPAPAPVPASNATSERIKALAQAAQKELNEGEEEDAPDAWALRQLELGLHRRRGGEATEVTETSLDEEIAKLSSRDGVAQVRKAAERVAKGHDGEAATRAKASVIPAASEAMARLWGTIKGLEGSAGDREAKLAELTAQAEAARDELAEIERRDKEISRMLRSVQELEELAWSLGGLLDEKSPKCKQASRMLAQIEEDFSRRRTKRRAKDMAEALQETGASLTYRQEEDEAEEGSDVEKSEQASARRRQRRSQSKGDDGWDTSDLSEEDGLEQTRKDRSIFSAAVQKQLLDDVSEEFASARSVLKALKSAKKKLQDEYRQAFVHLALPEVFGFFVDFSTLWWDPLRLLAGADDVIFGPRKAITSTQLETFDWFEDMAAFTELLGDDDPDGELVPKIVQQCIFPEVARRLRHCWDVTSMPQSQRAAALLDECLLFEVGEGAEAFGELAEAAVERLRAGLRTLAPEVFVQAAQVTTWYASAARKRLLRRSCKIATCAVQLEGRIPDEKLAPIILQDIFTTRLAPHLQAPRLRPEEMDLVERFVDALPDRWFENGLPQALRPLRDVLGPRAPPNAEATKSAAAAALRKMRCYDEAQALEL